jgi:uncharacterized membrane protein YdbT with pleckstrin-like domain
MKKISTKENKRKQKKTKENKRKQKKTKENKRKQKKTNRKREKTRMIFPSTIGTFLLNAIEAIAPAV